MADASVNKFETTVLPALQLAQDELISAGMESSPTNEAFCELTQLDPDIRAQSTPLSPEKMASPNENPHMSQ